MFFCRGEKKFVLGFKPIILFSLLVFVVLLAPYSSSLLVENGTLLRYGNESFNVTYNLSNNVSFHNNISVYDNISILFDGIDNVSLVTANLSIRIINWTNLSHEFWIVGEDNNVSVLVFKYGWKATVKYNDSIVSNDFFNATSSEVNFSYYTKPNIVLQDIVDSSEQNPTMTFTATDCCDSRLNCTLFVNDVNRGNNASTMNGTSTIIVSGNVPEGTNNFYVNCSNSQVDGLNKSNVHTFFRGGTGGSGGGSGGTGGVTPVTGCDLLFEPSFLSFDSNKTSDSLNFSNVGETVCSISLSKFFVPTFFGVKDLVIISDDSFFVYPGEEFFVNVSLSDISFVRDNTTTYVYVNVSGNFSFAIPLYILGVPTVFYGLSVFSEKFFYYPNEVVELNVSIENKGVVISNDSFLVVKVVNPDGLEVFLSEDNLSGVGIGITLIEKSFVLSNDSVSGMYRISVEYFTDEQGLLVASNDFYVGFIGRFIYDEEGLSWWKVSLIVLLGILLLGGVVIFFVRISRRKRPPEERVTSITEE